MSNDSILLAECALIWPVAMIGVLLGVIGYLRGARWLGSTTILVSTVAFLIWLMA